MSNLYVEYLKSLLSSGEPLSITLKSEPTKVLKFKTNKKINVDERVLIGKVKGIVTDINEFVTVQLKEKVSGTVTITLERDYHRKILTKQLADLDFCKIHFEFIERFEKVVLGRLRGHKEEMNVETKADDSDVNYSEVNDSKVNNSEVNDLKLNDFEVNESKVNESKVNDLSVKLKDLRITVQKNSNADSGEDIQSIKSLFEFVNEPENDLEKKIDTLIGTRMNFKIHGPPGTGKTSLLVNVLKKLVDSKKTILVCGPSNLSVDNVIGKFRQSKGNFFKRYGGLISKKKNIYNKDTRGKGKFKNKMRKVGNKKNKSEKGIKKDVKSRNNIEISGKTSQNDVKNAPKYRDDQLIFSTLFSVYKIKREFDYVIVDECCQATEPEIVLATSKGKNFILVGDPYQLGPVVTFDSIDQKITDNFFKLFKEKLPEKHLKQDVDINTLNVEQKVCHRNTEDICLVNSEYKNDRNKHVKNKVLDT
ncbi:DNA polymerase alpha-associated DNA helicase A, partial [Dictyocoela roeselum]